MSTTIDSRVVEMSFDNRNFESNVQTSLGTLEKLKSSLDVSNMAKGFENVEAAVRGTNFGVFGDAVGTVTEKFSALEQIAIGALRRIGEQVLNTGEQMLKSITVEPIKQGFEEYELKMGSIQTIMAGSGADLDTVNAKLAELNTYADKTIYSFSDMTSNIGKFTNAGVDLDMAVAAIQGISNEAALSGANANEASRAMYNFAQALSAGYVKLIDWKSIENANMATVEFKTQLLEMAVACGNAEKTADGMYRVLTTNNKGDTMGEVISATHNFNESLQYQWMTTDVLTQTLANYADENTEIGKRAFAAAQDIKTFSQMMDTLKEAAGSGWSETFELIFGNFEEAKKLWTGIGNTVGGWIQASADARNKFLSDWKNGYMEIDEYGNYIYISGRESLINAFSNIFEAISKIVTPIKEAFQEIFKPLSGTGFAKITHNFELFTEKLIISDDAASKIKEVFKALFTIINDLGTAIGKAIGFIVDLGKKALPALEPVGNVIKDIGSKIYDFIVSFTSNEDRWASLKTTIENIVEFIKSAPGKIDTAFQQLTGITIGEAFTRLGDSIQGAYEKVKEFFGKFGNIDTSGLDEFKSSAEEKLTPISNFFEGLKNLFRGVVDFFSGIAPILSAAISVIGDVLSTIGGWLKDKFGNLDSEDFKNILTGGGLAAIALTIKDVISSFEDIGKNAAKMIDGVTGVLNSVKGCFEAYQKDLKANTLLKIAAAIGVMTAAILVLTTIEPDKLIPAAAAVGALAGILVAAMAILSSKKFDTDKLNQATTDILKMSASMVLTGLAVKKVADAIVELMGPIQQFSQMQWGEIAKGLVGVGAVLGELFVFFKFIDSSKISLSTSISIAIIAAALAALSEIVKMFGNLPIETFVQGLIGIGLGLGEVVLFLNLVPNNSAEKAASITLISAALLVLCGALSTFGLLPLKVLTQGLISVAIALGEMVLFLNLMEGTLDGSAALLIAAAAIAALVPSIVALGVLPIATLAVGIAALGVALLALVGVGTLANAAVVGLLALGAAVTMIGAGAAMAGVGLVSIAAGLSALAGAAVVGVKALDTLITGLIMLIPNIAKAIGEGIITIMQTIASNVSTMIELALSIGRTLIAALRDLIPEVIDLVVETAQKLASAAPAFDQAITDMLISLLETIKNNIGPITEILVDTFTNWLDALGEKLPQINQSLFDFLMNLIEGFGQSAEDNAEKLRETMISLGKHMLNAIKNFFGIHSPSTVMADIGKQLILGLINGIWSLLTSLLSKLGELMSKALQAIKDKFSEWLQVGKDLIEKVKTGIHDKIEAIKSKVTELMTNAKQMITDKFEEWKESAHNLIEKVKDGVNDKINVFKDKITELVNNGKKMITDKFEEWRNAAKDLIEKVKTGVNDKIQVFKSKVTELINNGKKMITDKFEEWKTAGKDLIEKVKTGVNDKIQIFKNKVTELVNGGKKMITDKFEEWKTSGKDLIEKVKTGVNDKMQIFKNKVTELVNNGKKMITDKFEEWKTAGQNLWDNIKTGVGDKAEEFNTKVTTIVNEAKGKIGDKFEEWKNAGMDLLGKVQAGLEDPNTASKWYTAVATIISSGKGKIDEKLEEWKTSGETLLTNVRDGFDSFREDFTSKVSGIISEAKNSFLGQKLTEWWSAGLDLIGKVWEGISSFTSSLVAGVSAVVSSAWNDITSATTITDWFNAGINLINGLIRGVGDMVGDFIRACTDLASEGKRSIERFFGIKSPSRVMRQVGRYFDEGLILGIEDYSRDVADASEGVGSSALDAMTYALSKLNDAIEFGIDDSPTIRPVLDLTDFNRGIGIIDDSFAKAGGMNLGNVYGRFAGVMSDNSLLNGYSETSNGATQFNFTQNNYSPKALSRIDIYRQTKNQFSAMERAVAQA